MWYVYASDECYECGLGRFDNEAFLGVASDLSMTYKLLSGILGKVQRGKVVSYAIYFLGALPPRFYQLACTKSAEKHVIRYTYTWNNRYDDDDVLETHVVTLPIAISFSELTEATEKVCNEIGATFVTALWFMADMRFFTDPMVTIEYQGHTLRVGISEDVLTHADAKALIKPLLIERIEQHMQWLRENEWITKGGASGVGFDPSATTVTLSQEPKWGLRL